MSEVVVIKPQTAKEQMTNHLVDMVVGQEFTVPATDRGKWSVHISCFIHPIYDMRFSVITDKEVAPDGQAIIKRIQ